MYFNWEEKVSLIKELAIAELKHKEQNNILGWLWIFLYPLVMSAIMYYVFLNWTGKQVDNFALYLLVGVVNWNYLVNATSAACNILENRNDYVKLFSFPYELLIVASAMSSFMAYTVQILAVFFLSHGFYGVRSYLVLFLPLFLLIQTLFVLGVSFVLVSLYIYIRDMEYIWSITLRLAIFITPVFYSINMIGEKLRIFLLFNPMFYFLNINRAVIAQREFPAMGDVIIASAVSVAMFIIGIVSFRNLSKKISESI